MDTSTANTPVAYRQTSGALALAWLGLLLILFGLTAPSYCFGDGECKFFRDALFNYHNFENGWREGLVTNSLALEIVAVLLSIVVAIRLRVRSAMLMGVLAVFVVIGLVYQTVAYLVSNLEWLDAELRIGWGIIIFGCLLLGIAVARPRETYMPEAAIDRLYRWPNNTQVILAVLGLVLFASGAILPVYCVDGVTCKINGEGALFRADVFDEEFRLGLATTRTGVTAFGLALIIFASLVIPSNRRNPRNYALIVATVAAIAWLVVLFILIVVSLSVLDTGKLLWGWIPFWVGAILLVVAAWKKADVEPMPLAPDGENIGNEEDSELLSGAPIQD